MPPQFGKSKTRKGAAVGKSALKAKHLLAQALVSHREGQLAQARSLYDAVLKLQPQQFDALHLSGVIAAQTKEFERAVTLINRAIEVNPHDAAAYSNRGIALKELKQLDAALQSYDRAIALKPDYAYAYYNRGIVLKELKQLDAALQSYDRAIALKPDYAEAYSNRGIVLKELKQLDAALQSYDRAIALKPDYADAYCNRGNTLKDINQLDAALQSYGRAIAIDPDYAEAHWNLGLCCLLQGDFEKGWAECEWRWKIEKISTLAGRRTFPEPLWLGGEPLNGKSILLYAEQGLGDTLQFCRYAKLVCDLGARAILEVQPPLLKLLENMEGVAKVVAKGASLPAFDYQCPILSLPLAFKTNMDTIPAWHNYVRADPGKVSDWQARLGEKHKPRLGLVWSGNTNHKNDHNRSIALVDLVRLLSPDYQFISLQKEVRHTDNEVLQAHKQLLHLGEELRDFSDTAALCELMDIVISVDTSIAHLAGALGKEVWILLPFSPDWRWLLDRDDSVWYPTARLYRQTTIGNWASVIDRLTGDLKQRFDMR